MEYKVYKFLKYLNIPLFLRVIISVILLLLALIQIILPVYPWSWIAWIFLIVISILFFIPWNKIRYVIKLRKSFIYMLKNIFNKKIIKHKFYDLISHIKMIFREKR